MGDNGGQWYSNNVWSLGILAVGRWTPGWLQLPLGRTPFSLQGPWSCQADGRLAETRTMAGQKPRSSWVWVEGIGCGLGLGGRQEYVGWSRLAVCPGKARLPPGLRALVGR